MKTYKVRCKNCGSETVNAMPQYHDSIVFECQSCGYKDNFGNEDYCRKRDWEW